MNIFKKNINLLADVFPILRAPKNVIKQICKKFSLRGPFSKQHAKGDQTLLKSERHHLYHIYWSVWKQLSWKKSLLVICILWRVFLNTLTAHHRYSLLNRDKLRQPIQMQFYQNKENFLNSFLGFWKLD